ncbi:MAG: hypothetical protein IPG99_15905 [Ignavibacteria bacterium]|nr:hypothetical protein [Ignavibacteria bacterium]
MDALKRQAGPFGIVWKTWELHQPQSKHQQSAVIESSIIGGGVKIESGLL